MGRLSPITGIPSTGMGSASVAGCCSPTVAHQGRLSQSGRKRAVPDHV